MQLDLTEGETHWLRHAIIEAAAKAQGTKAQEIYLDILVKLSDPKHRQNLAELPAGTQVEPPRNQIYDQSRGGFYLG